MSELYNLIDYSIEFSKKHRTGDFKRVTFPVFTGSSYCIYQKYSTIPFELCFWELHEEFIDINVWLDGDEKLQSSNPLNDLSIMDIKGEDFWTTDKFLPLYNSATLNDSVPIVMFNANIPHKCQIQSNYDFIEKLTLKIHREELTRLF